MLSIHNETVQSCNMYKCSRISNYWGILGVSTRIIFILLAHLFYDIYVTKPWKVMDCQFLYKAHVFCHIFINVAKLDAKLNYWRKMFGVEWVEAQIIFSIERQISFSYICCNGCFLFFIHSVAKIGWVHCTCIYSKVTRSERTWYYYSMGRYLVYLVVHPNQK